MQSDIWDEDQLPAELDADQSEWQIAMSSGDWDLVDEDVADDQHDASELDLAAPSAEQINELMNQIGAASQFASGSIVQAAGDKAIVRPAAGNENRVTEPTGGGGSVKKSARHQGPVVTIESLDPELREAFMDDASSCVGSMEQALLRLESDPADANALNEICRQLHTLKGASASVGLSQLADQLHRLEDTLCDDQQAKRTPDINSLLQTVDSIRSQVAGSVPSQPSTTTAPAPQPKITSFDDGPDDDESVRVKSSQLNRLMDMLAQLVMLRNRRETELAELQEVYHELIGSAAKMRLLSNETDPDSVVCSSLQLSEVANDVFEIAGQVRDCARPIAEGNAAVSQFIREFRQELVELRRTPIAGLFGRLQRVVRDAAEVESKQVCLQLIGEEAGIERSLQQRLYEPLLHIVRNSVCHGIESPDDRERSGKPRSGTITLEAQSGPDLFVIEICDDGRGLDYDAIRRRGVESGLLAADQSASEHDLSQLIFQPGFSTRQTADQVAGRGVGMDVVASTLQRMRGWLEVESESTRGTRIRLSFPLPSVIQHAMVFRAGGQLFALPMQAVQSTGQPATGPGESQSNRLIMADLIGAQQGAASENSQQLVLTGEASNSTSASANRSSRVTLVVDEILGPEELVVRPLPALLKHHPYCCGATLSGMGQIVLFLDARHLVQSQRGNLHPQSNGQQPQSGASSGKSGPPATARPRVLVVDDSISARKRVVRSLRRYAVEIVEAGDGKQALSLLKRENFDAVFSDMEMPHVSGMELLADINSQHDPNAPPVVIISSRNEDEFTLRARELGANDYLFKPLTDEALDGAINKLPTLCHLIPVPPIDFPIPGELP